MKSIYKAKTNRDGTSGARLRTGLPLCAFQATAAEGLYSTNLTDGNVINIQQPLLKCYKLSLITANAAEGMAVSLLLEGDV